MPKILTGTVVSTGMNKTIVVEVTSRKPHPMYKKLVRHSKKFKVDPGEKQVQIGDVVTIVETRPLSKTKYFKLLEEKK